MTPIEAPEIFASLVRSLAGDATAR